MPPPETDGRTRTVRQGPHGTISRETFPDEEVTTASIEEILRSTELTAGIIAGIHTQIFPNGKVNGHNARKIMDTIRLGIVRAGRLQAQQENDEEPPALPQEAQTQLDAIRDLLLTFVRSEKPAFTA